MAVDDGTYAEYIAIVEVAHGVLLTPAQVDQLIERLDDEARLFPPMPFARALRIATGQEAGPVISVREHALAVAAELEG